MTKEEVEMFVGEMMENYVDDRLIVDPPSGWAFGFPKPYFKNAIKDKDELNKWLIENGYPEREIERFGAYFPVRFWMQRD